MNSTTLILNLNRISTNGQENYSYCFYGNRKQIEFSHSQPERLYPNPGFEINFIELFSCSVERLVAFTHAHFSANKR
jgi:hypothetical protein